MFGHERRTRDLFEQQFEPDGDSFLYRPRKTAPPVRVTRAERDRFCETFVRGQRWVIAGSICMMVLPIMAIAFVAPDLLDGPEADRVMWILVAAFLGAFLLAWHHVWRIPARALADRAPAGRARSAAEARHHALQSISWGQLATGGAVTAVLLFRLGLEHDLTHGWYRLWLVFAAAMAILLLVQCFRKWRLARRP